jgi:2-polyprenyl-3-methyl-5-hydroxy-6-metoxy-1,4-benzoquinol methylase
MSNHQVNAYLAQHLGKSYLFNENSNLWSRPGFTGIAYSDGIDAEKRLLEIISNSQDIGTLSTELRQHCTDWMSLYHLSAARANVLRPLASCLKGDILEIGAGCGAITRFLGESGANVLALEGSLRRATIARSRTRDLSNVTVLAERFSDFELEHKFDVVTLIGVLEYANLFTDANNAPLAMLQKVRSLLKPEGRLIIAIENQLGLKYFAGAHEDHVGVPMFGVEDRYTNKSVRTFGMRELTALLCEAGFPVSDFLACFPDYKLPSSIITAHGLRHPTFDPSPLASQSVAKDHLKPEYLCFSPELAWPAVMRNGLGLDLANSFLVSAGGSDEVKVPQEILAYHYSSERRPEFTKEAIFETNELAEIAVTYHSLSHGQSSLKAKASVGSWQLNFNVPSKAPYVTGPALSQDFLRLVTTPGWSHDDLQIFLNGYLKTLGDLSGRQTSVTLADQLPGRFIDCIPTNLIKTKTLKLEFIDTEWSLSEDVSVEWLLFRSLLVLTALPADYSLDEHGRTYTYEEFFCLCYRLVGSHMDKTTLGKLFEKELTLQSTATGDSFDKFDLDSFFGRSTPHKKYPEVLIEYKNLNDQLTHQINQISNELQSIKSSRKWRLAIKISEKTPTVIKWIIRRFLVVKKNAG